MCTTSESDWVKFGPFAISEFFGSCSRQIADRSSRNSHVATLNKYRSDVHFDLSYAARALLDRLVPRTFVSFSSRAVHI